MKLRAPVWLREGVVLIVGAVSAVNVFAYTVRAAWAMRVRPPLAEWTGIKPGSDWPADAGPRGNTPSAGPKGNTPSGGPRRTNTPPPGPAGNTPPSGPAGNVP